MQFHMIICGLDSVEARRWINATLVNMIDEENPESLKPLIDGGTEGIALPRYSRLIRLTCYSRLSRSSSSHLPNHHILLRMLS